MKKGMVLVAAVMLAAVMMLAGCSQGAKEVDVDALAKQLASEVTYAEQLESIDAATAERVYQIDAADVTTAAAGVGTGATVDEYSVWQAVDSAAAGRIKAAAEARIASQKEMYADYNPGEVPKLDGAVIVQSGNYVAVCITADTENAKKIIDGALK
ncbi:MAG: DUF4358 domain-containing protein [Christensenella sp.]|nr:DUF4358 domain-containing protein [Christensenella sp.]